MLPSVFEVSNLILLKCTGSDDYNLCACLVLDQLLAKYPSGDIARYTVL